MWNIFKSDMKMRLDIMITEFEKDKDNLTSHEKAVLGSLYYIKYGDIEKAKAVFGSNDRQNLRGDKQ